MNEDQCTSEEISSLGLSCGLYLNSEDKKLLCKDLCESYESNKTKCEISDRQTDCIYLESPLPLLSPGECVNKVCYY
jgi:hypothetical protein